MKKLFIAVLMMALPILAFGQYTELTPGFDGSPNSYFGSWGANAENYVKLTPTASSIRLDSVRVYGYRPATTTAQTLNIRVTIYSPDAAITGDCGCTDGPGTVLRQYPSATTTYAMNWGTGVTGAKWFAFQLPPDTITGAFIVGIKYVSVTAPGTAYPSVLFDDGTTPIACCNQYWNYQAAPGIRDNEGMFTNTPGPQYIAIKGTVFGQAAPGHLTISNLYGFGPALLDSTVVDTLLLGNSGGTTLTISDIHSSNGDFTTDPVGAGIVIAPGATHRLAVYFTPSAEGIASATLEFTDDVPASVVTAQELTGTGVGWTNLVFFENFWNENSVNGGWTQYRFDSLASQDWSFYYDGQHAGAVHNVWAGHTYSSADSFVTDILGTPQLTAPVGGTVTVNYYERVFWYPDYYEFHGLCLADSDTTWSVIAELLPADVNDWTDHPTTWYVTGLDSEYTQFMLGFLYQGADATTWYVDDILVKDVPQVPPFLTSEPRGDAFDSGQELVADAFDPNNDPFVVEAHIEEVTATFTAYTMTETPAGSGHFCINFTDFLTGAGTYNYYITATDDDGETRFPETGYYTFEVQSQAGATEIVYHDGSWENAHYYNNFDSEDAVQFTPAAYPFMLTGAKVAILNLFPDAAHQQIVVKVYDDDGAAGLPGTVLYEGTTGSIGNECDGLIDTAYVYYYAPVVFHTDLTINDGTFYISVKNPSDAVAGACEAWCFDTLGLGNSYYYDAAAESWTPLATEDGDVMINALGYAVADPILTLYPNPVNTTASIYVHSAPGTPITGALPFPMNLYVSTTPGGAQTLVAGSPFTTSPISVSTTVDARDFFNAKYLYGPVDLMREIPTVEPDYVTTSVLTPTPAGIGIAHLTDDVVTNFDPSLELPAPVNFNTPTLVTLNEVTGEKQVASMKRHLGKANYTISHDKAMRGPVRELPSERMSFETAR